VFWWEYLNEEELSVGKSEPFEERESAESWLAGEWEALLGRGIVEVMLFDEEEDVCLYRMSLKPEEG
jgi:hypothetical protein